LLIRLEAVSKTYEIEQLKVQALREVNLGLDQAQIVVLIGASGSGKTTLMNIASGLDLPTQGRVFFQDELLSELSVNDRAKIRSKHMGFVFQLYNLLPTMSAVENVELPLIYQQVPFEERRAIAERLLGNVGLRDRVEHWPSELSGGEQQRVALSRALVMNPEVVFADEPTSNVDTRTGMDILNLMVNMTREKGTTFLIATHDPKVLEVATRVITVRDGIVKEEVSEEFKTTSY
jgi:putative ABC transport system ATP-binding protein